MLFQSLYKALFILKFLMLLTYSTAIKAYGSSSSDSEIDSAIKIFEKAIFLSPELMEPKTQAVIPYYKIKGHKIPLDDGFWILTKNWIDLYLQEIKKDCSKCELDSQKLLETAQVYIPQNKFNQKIVHKSSHAVENLSRIGVHLTAKYGKTAATLKVSSEIAETILSVGLGMKGVHLICNVFDLMIFPLVRTVQKYGRSLFQYGPQFNYNPFITPVKMAWLSRKINKSKKNTFFFMGQALEFNQAELEKLNSQGPSSLFKRKGHRLLWLKQIQTKTDPIFEELKLAKQKLNNPLETDKTYNKKTARRIKNLEKQLENILKINRKNFFGARFKRFLLLKSRKGRTSYMNSSDLSIQKKMGLANKIFWPLAPQYLIENSLDKNKIESYKSETLLTENNKSSQTQADEVITGLIKEFLQKINQSENLESKQKSIEFFLLDFHKIFDVTKKTESRVMSAYAVEILLSHFFSYYLNIATAKISEKHSLSYREKIKLYWHIGRVEKMAFEFTDFLTAVAVTKNKKYIQFYKYESIEKFFSFLDFFNQVNESLKQNLDSKNLLSNLIEKTRNIQNFSLTTEKNSIVNFIPFVKKRPQCRQLVEKY